MLLPMADVAMCLPQNLLQVCERIPTIGTQLKILSTVKATMLGAQGEQGDTTLLGMTQKALFRDKTV